MAPSSTEPDTPAPEGISRAQVAADVPALLPLVDECPGIHIYTAASPHYAALAEASVASTDVFDRALVRPTSEVEVAAAVRVCGAAVAAGALPALAIRNGAYDPGERSRTEGGVTLDVRSLAAIDIAPDRRSVRIGGGVVLGTLLARLDRENLDTPTGWGAQIGYVGWASAGGYGLSVAARGMGVDQILGGRVVTASGEVVVVSEEDAAAGDETAKDVLWALRGAGGGVLGVVTELTVRLYPRPRLIGGQMLFPRAEAAAVFSGLQALYDEDADADGDGRHPFCAEVIIVDPLANGGIIVVYFWYELNSDTDATGDDHARARALHDRVATFGTLLSDSVVDSDGKLHETTPYAFLEEVEFKALKPTRQSFRLTNLTTPSFSAALGAIFAARPFPTPSSVIVMHVCHGAGTRPDPAATAFAHRAPHVVFSVTGIADWDDAGGRAAAAAWVPALIGDVEAAGLATGWKYSNFNPKEPGDGRLYLGADGVARLRRIKARYDPHLLFAKSTHDLGE